MMKELSFVYIPIFKSKGKTIYWYTQGSYSFLSHSWSHFQDEGTGLYLSFSVCFNPIVSTHLLSLSFNKFDWINMIVITFAPFPGT